MLGLDFCGYISYKTKKEKNEKETTTTYKLLIVMETALLAELEQKLDKLYSTQYHNDIIIRNRKFDLKRQCYLLSYKELLISMKNKYRASLAENDPAQAIFQDEIERLKEQINNLQKDLDEEVEFVKFLKLRRSYFASEINRLEFKLLKQEKEEERWELLC